MILIWAASVLYTTISVYNSWDKFNCPFLYYNNPYIVHKCERCCKHDGTRHEFVRPYTYFY